MLAFLLINFAGYFAVVFIIFFATDYIIFNMEFFLRWADIRTSL